MGPEFKYDLSKIIQQILIIILQRIATSFCISVKAHGISTPLLTGYRK